MALDAFRDELAATAAALASPGTGLLAADESNGTIGKRFAAIGLENTEANRRAYRSLLTTTDGLADHISGVILFEETLFQGSVDAQGPPGARIVELFAAQGIVPGIKGEAAERGHDPHAVAFAVAVRVSPELRVAGADARSSRSTSGRGRAAAVPWLRS
jgi:fructose-bisphosphate aldolase class I